MTTTMTTEGMMMEISMVDDIIRRLLEGKGGKQVQLSEIEIRQLCVNARQIFLSQPNLLDLHAPIRICGTPPPLSLKKILILIIYIFMFSFVYYVITNYEKYYKYGYEYR